MKDKTMQILNTQHDYRQFIGDTLLSKIKGQTYQEGSLRKMGDTEARENVIKFGGQIGENQTLDIEDLLFGRSTRLRILNGEYQYSSIVYTNNNNKFLPRLNPNELGERKTIDTPLGEMKVGVKIDDEIILCLDQLSQLSNFDTNNDGFVGVGDIGAKNLVLIGYDKDGAEVAFNFLDVMGGIDITQFFDCPKSETKKVFAAILRPEESHEQLKKENILDFFKAYADKSGWIDFTNPDIAEKIFGNNELDLSYRKKNADGTTKLERIYFNEDIESLRKMQKEGGRSFGWEYHAAKSLRNAGKDYVFNSNDTGALERLKNGSISYEYDSALRRMNGYSLYDAYEPSRKQLNSVIEAIDKMGATMNDASPTALNLAHLFHSATGLNYSEENFAKVKEGLESGGIEFLETLNNNANLTSDFVIGMQLNDIAGNITMLFGSGKEIKIAMEDLYSGNGELNMDADGNRASLMNEAREMSEEDLNNLDFAQVGIKDETGIIVSLKDLGITAIQKATYPDGRFLSFILTNADGNKINAQDLYNIFFVTSGGLESSHKEDSNVESNPESKSALENANKDSDSLSSKIRKMSNPLVYPNKPSVDVRI